MSKFWMYVLICGLFFGSLPGIAAWNYTNGRWYAKLFTTIITMGLIGLLIGSIMYFEDKNAVEVWNDGYCRNCGEKLEFRNGSKYRGTTTYYYICPGCNNVVETGRH